ncbi:MAG: hypothetical protein PUH21_05655 [Prevotellaceae bacterium]|nr:hypothetical protein [Prevotellaceae bacterium]MDY3856810.1 hypothetical protein [Bacteroidaceae bacterium]
MIDPAAHLSMVKSGLTDIKPRLTRTTSGPLATRSHLISAKSRYYILSPLTQRPAVLS